MEGNYIITYTNNVYLRVHVHEYHSRFPDTHSVFFIDFQCVRMCAHVIFSHWFFKIFFWFFLSFFPCKNTVHMSQVEFLSAIYTRTRK